MAVFHATFHTDSTFAATFRSSATFAASFGNSVVVPVADYYDGEYEVTPRLEDQVLPTRALAMRDDLTVKEIPVTYTSNIFDGKTVVIG